MGKVKTAILGSEAEQESKERRTREREEKKKRVAAAEEKIHIPGMKGGEKMKSVGPTTDEEIEKMAKLARSVEESQEGTKESSAKKPKKQRKARVRGKRYQEALTKVDHNKLYLIKEALTLLKEISLTKFDPSVEVHINTTDKGLRGTVSLPHGTGKKIRVKIADVSNVEEIVAEVEKGKFEFDVLIAHPAIMVKLAKVARFLGPKGLMPNPKNGTISPKPQEVAKKMEAGEINWKTEAEFPIIHLVIGKLSFKDSQLEENFSALIHSITEPKIKSITLKSSMSPGIKIKI